MSTTIEAPARLRPGPISGADLLELGRVFEAWRDPPAYEPTDEDIFGSTVNIPDLDEALDVRGTCL